MPSIADVKRQRASMKKLLPDACTITRRSVDSRGVRSNNFDTTVGTNVCRVMPIIMRYPRDNPFSLAYAHEMESMKEDDRFMEIGWDATPLKGDQIVVTNRETSLVTKYKVENSITDLSMGGNILLRVQRIPL